MNEEYNIYYRNTFGRLKNIFISVHRNMMRKSATAKVERLNAEIYDIVGLKERYDDDLSRLKLLAKIIESLKSRIDKCRNCSTAQCESREEQSRLAGALHRRMAEYNRLEKEIERKYDRISELLRKKTRSESCNIISEQSVYDSQLYTSCYLL